MFVNPLIEMHKLPYGWTTAGPFGIWNHPKGFEIVNVEPGYVLKNDTTGDTIGEYESLDEALEASKPFVEATNG